jgi:hypothetical protein
MTTHLTSAFHSSAWSAAAARWANGPVLSCRLTGRQATWQAALAPQHEPDDLSARLDTLQARADEAAQRLAADNTDREARAQYTARIEREAHADAEPAAEWQAEASEGIEIEM